MYYIYESEEMGMFAVYSETETGVDLIAQDIIWDAEYVDETPYKTEIDAMGLDVF